MNSAPGPAPPPLSASASPSPPPTAIPKGGLRCQWHPDRPAAARCQSCGSYFCRDCVSEHDLRMICSSCLSAMANPAEKSRGRWPLWPTLVVVGQAACGLVVLWLLFYFIGSTLIQIPADFHEFGAPPEVRQAR